MILIPRERPKAKWAHLKRYAAAVLLALTAHGLFLILAMFLSFLQLSFPSSRAPAKNPVVLRNLSSEQWAQNRGQQKHAPNGESKSAAKERKKEPEKPKEPEKMPKQVVDTAPGNGQEDPNAKYAAESSNKVQKETRAREQDQFYKNPMPRRTTTTPSEGQGADAVEKAQIAGNEGIGQDDRPVREGAQKQTIEIPEQRQRSEIAMRESSKLNSGADIPNRRESEEIRGNSNRLMLLPGKESAGEDASEGHVGIPGVVSLLPSSAALDKITGAAANDHLPDVEKGDGTYLNTKEWKYASFMNRVHRSVSQSWNPGAQLMLRDPTGRIYGGRDRHTVLSITLTSEGKVKDIFVEKSCGVDFLDVEAIHAFERAQPFPNPPAGLVDADAAVRFRFGFYIEMSGSPAMRLFRAN